MIIRKECIGQGYSKKSPYNDCHFKGVITDNPENFALYKVLQLDVFEKDIPPPAEIENGNTLTVEQVIGVIHELTDPPKTKNKNKNK